MKYLLLSLLFIFDSISAATVIIYNKSDKPVTVGLWYSDKGAVSATAIVGINTLQILVATSSGLYYIPQLIPIKDRRGIVKYKTELINPGKSTYIDSGLNDINAIDFLPPGATEKITFNPDISWWRTFARVEYRSPNDIKRM